jgi:hypothetical protein
LSGAAPDIFLSQGTLERKDVLASRLVLIDESAEVIGGPERATAAQEASRRGRSDGFGLRNAHPAPEFGQTPGLPMGRRHFVPNPLAAQSIGGNQWWKGISSYL